MLDWTTMYKFVLFPCLVAWTVLVGCGEKPLTEEDRQDITQALRDYLPVLAKGYTSGNLESLKEFAAEREVARVFTRVSELADEGKFVEPTFREMTVEDIQVWGHANAFVTTLEVWDLRVYANGSQSLLGQELDQSNRVKYQLKRRGPRWEVLLRELDQAIQ